MRGVHALPEVEGLAIKKIDHPAKLQPQKMQVVRAGRCVPLRVCIAKRQCAHTLRPL